MRASVLIHALFDSFDVDAVYLDPAFFSDRELPGHWG